jgi:ribonuclease VapC
MAPSSRSRRSAEYCFIRTASHEPNYSATRFNELISDLGIIIEPVTAHQATVAREAHRRFGRGSGHPAKLNFGDCFAYALATELDEPLLFVGQDFMHTDVRRVLD